MPSSSALPHLAITLGDPAGIGPEVVLKALANRDWSNATTLTVFGSQQIIEQTITKLQQVGQSLALPEIAYQEIPFSGEITWGEGTAVTGDASFQYLDAAIAATLAGEFDGIVTAPIAKAAWQAAGHAYPGQTEVLAHRAEVDCFGMLFVGQSPLTGWMLRTLLATTHIPLGKVPQALTPELMTAKLALLLASLKTDFGITEPTVAIAGLNPHSGEAGNLGTEEVDWLFPWLATVREWFPKATLRGLVPPDTMWVAPGKAWLTDPSASNVDAFLALYHDQGLIPVKLLAFDQAINTTIGLPFIRTSPDHGTAFDIAGQGIARADSMVAAIDLAIQIVQQRKRNNAR